MCSVPTVIYAEKGKFVAASRKDLIYYEAKLLFLTLAILQVSDFIFRDDKLP